MSALEKHLYVICFLINRFSCGGYNRIWTYILSLMRRWHLPLWYVSKERVSHGLRHPRINWIWVSSKARSFLWHPYYTITFFFLSTIFLKIKKIPCRTSKARALIWSTISNHSAWFYRFPAFQLNREGVLLANIFPNII